MNYLKHLAWLGILAIVCGCGRSPTFINLGNGKGASYESIDAFAKQRGVSRQEAIRLMRDSPY